MSRAFLLGNKHARWVRDKEREDRLTPSQLQLGEVGAPPTNRIFYCGKVDEAGINAATVSGDQRVAGQGLVDLFRPTGIGSTTYEKIPNQYGGRITVYNWFSSPIAGNAWVMLEQDRFKRFWITAEDCPTTPGGNEKCPAWPSEEDWDDNRPATIYATFSLQPTCCIDINPAQNIAMQKETDCGDDCYYCADLNQVAGDEVKLFVSFANTSGITAWIQGTTGQNCSGRVNFNAAPITDPTNFDVTLAQTSATGDLSTCYAGATLRITTSTV